MVQKYLASRNNGQVKNPHDKERKEIIKVSSAFFHKNC